jgi:hypothetical protein
MSESNFLNNGAVLPQGLLGDDPQALLEGFAKSYKNFALRIGVVVKAYSVVNTNNISKLAPEYDVLVIEQNADKGATTILYKNCLSAEGLGSVADFFERTLRPKKKQTRKGDAVDLKGQNGAIVLLLCLDGMSDKGIILSALTHPDRKTKIVDDGPHMEGEFNGVNFKIQKDGSATLTFKGATDNDGKVIDASQGITTLTIAKDGSFEVKNNKIQTKWNKDGSMLVKAQADITIDTVKDVKVKAKNATITASGTATVEGKTVKLGTAAAQSAVLGDTFKALFDSHTHLGNLGAPTTPPMVPLLPTALSRKVKVE